MTPGVTIAAALLLGFVVGLVYGIIITERRLGRLWVEGENDDPTL